MFNAKRRLLTAATVAAVAVGSLLTASPAQAAGNCGGGAGAAIAPAALTGGRWALTNTRSRGYTGTPFTFQLVVERSVFPDGWQSQTYTFDNRGQGYRHSMNTGQLRRGATAIRVRTWCGGKRGADWVGRVRGRS